MQNPLVRVPAALPALQRANALRRRVEARLRSFDVEDWPGVVYGEHPLQRIRIWALNDLAPRDGWPAVLLIHGGGWREGDLSDFESLAPAFARRGIVAAAMNYRLSPEARWPAMLEDAHAALDRLRAAQVDPARIAVWGHSAGGQLALLLGLQRPADVRCVVAMGAPSDLTVLSREDSAAREVFTPEQRATASPLFQPCDVPPPILLVHGDADSVVPIGHARALATRWPDRVRTIELPEGDHGIRWPLPEALRARREAVRWVEEQLQPAGRGSKWRIRWSKR